MSRRLNIACLPTDRAAVTTALAPLGNPCGAPFGVPFPQRASADAADPAPEVYVSSLQTTEDIANDILAALAPTDALVEDGEVAS